MSRQHKWQVKQQAAGRCTQCGQSRGGWSQSLCNACAEKKRRRLGSRFMGRPAWGRPYEQTAQNPVLE